MPKVFGRINVGIAIYFTRLEILFAYLRIFLYYRWLFSGEALTPVRIRCLRTLGASVGQDTVGTGAICQHYLQCRMIYLLASTLADEVDFSGSFIVIYWLVARRSHLSSSKNTCSVSCMHFQLLSHP